MINYGPDELEDDYANRSWSYVVHLSSLQLNDYLDAIRQPGEDVEDAYDRVGFVGDWTIDNVYIEGQDNLSNELYLTYANRDARDAFVSDVESRIGQRPTTDDYDER